jgi:hypothetical protein
MFHFYGSSSTLFWSIDMSKKKPKIPMKGGDEFDALTTARKYYVYLTRSGVAKAIKKKYNKRFRRVQKEELRKGDE